MPIAHTPICLAFTCLFAAGAASAQTELAPGVSRLDLVQVTSTRFGESVQEVPDSISVVTADELRARGARDLRTALSLLGGVSVALGGDRGPAAAVPGLLGLREVDDLLLLIDGIPAGGAFVPAFEIVSLDNVERIEVLRGQAPVYFGTTAFAGTINVVHYPAGRAEGRVAVTYGSFGSVGARGSAVLSDDRIQQSISASASREQTNARAGFKRGEGAYRVGLPLAEGRATLDASLVALRQKSGSPSPVDATGRLTDSLSPDFNQNPRDARLDTDRYRIALGYERDTSIGRWGSTLGVTHSRAESIRGFLLPMDAVVSADNAAGYRQSRRIDEGFLDAHLTSRWTSALEVTSGLNELFGRARQDSRTFTYALPLDNGPVPSSADSTPKDVTALRDTRRFFGLYSQARYAFDLDTSLLAGVRWNRIRESRATSDADDSTSETRAQSRFSGSLGARARVWQDRAGDLDDVTVYATVGNTFQPAQIDFGPDAGAQPLLRPETQRSYSAGIKADGLDGRFDIDLSAFFVDFANQPVARQIGGQPILVNGGKERFRGIEIETTVRPLRAFTLAAHASYNDARYRDFVTSIDGVDVQLSGRRRALSPELLAGFAAVYAPQHGWRGSATFNRVGSRYLDAANAVGIRGYWIADATLGYAFDTVDVLLRATNIGNRRDATLASEIGEGQFYRLPARRVGIDLSFPLRGR